MASISIIYPLFKFSLKKYALGLINNGNIKIGTLYEYRDSENYKGKILDKDEGKFNVSTNFENGGSFKADDLGRIGIPIKGDGELTIEKNVVFGINKDHDDCLIYSTSAKFCIESINEAIKENYDSCVLIKNPINFFKIISRKKILGDYKGFFPCIYTDDRNIQLKHGTDAELMNIYRELPGTIVKPADHRHFYEVRGIWIPKSKLLGSKIFNIPQLINECTELDFSTLDLNLLSNKNKKQKIGIKLIIKNHNKPSEINYKYPVDIFSPVVIRDFSKNLNIGFMPPFPYLKKYEVISTNNYNPPLPTKEFPIYMITPFEKVKKIVYYNQILK